MRTTIVLLVDAVLVGAVLLACRARDDSAADSATSDSAPPDGSAADTGVVAIDTASPATPPHEASSRASTPEVRRAETPARDSTLPPEDSVRAMRPRLPQVTPGNRPRTWRGFKLPEERSVRVPVETLRRVEQVPDSVMKGDSTKPPKPAR
jgi:outer membrane biosynthesis protein TonB